MFVCDVPISDVLRTKIADCGLSYRQLAKEIDVPHPTISRFMTGDRGLRLDVIESLVEYFDLELTDKPKRGGSEK